MRCSNPNISAPTNDLCPTTGGACAVARPAVASAVPPAVGDAPGFLSVLDMPLFGGIRADWAATEPESRTNNPAETSCDRADFIEGGAVGLRSRSFVVPKTTKLDVVFGLTQSIGTFRDAKDAKAFMARVSADVDGCTKRQRSLRVIRAEDLRDGDVLGRAWEVRARRSKDDALTYRIGLVRDGDTVTQVTFTPSGGYDVGTDAFNRLVERTAARLTQLP